MFQGHTCKVNFSCTVYISQRFDYLQSQLCMCMCNISRRIQMMIVLEFLPNGDLRDYLIRHKPA